MPAKRTVVQALQLIGRSVFSTREIADLRQGSLSSTSQTLAQLSVQEVIRRVKRGVWCLPSHERFSPFAVVPFLLPGQRVYVSFISALHLHGLIEQIPQVIYAATTGHTRAIRTDVGTYSFHQLKPEFFRGFEWHGKRHDFLIATPEKALVDSLYLSSRRGNRFGTFPELNLGGNFKFSRAAKWVKLIPDKRIRSNVLGKLEDLLAAKEAENGRN